MYERHTTYLYRFALRHTAGDEDDAQDLVHDAWVRAVQRLAVFEWKSQLRTWLAGFVVILGGLLNMGIFLKIGGQFLIHVSGAPEMHLKWVMTGAE